jgi:hypothetical protein
LIVGERETRSATARGDGDLAVDGDALADLDAAEIRHQHERQQHREFDRGHAALAASEIAQAQGEPGESGCGGHGWDGSLVGHGPDW